MFITSSPKTYAGVLHWSRNQRCLEVAVLSRLHLDPIFFHEAVLSWIGSRAKLDPGRVHKSMFSNRNASRLNTKMTSGRECDISLRLFQLLAYAEILWGGLRSGLPLSHIGQRVGREYITHNPTMPPHHLYSSTDHAFYLTRPLKIKENNPY